MGQLVLLVVAAAWAAVLIPPLLRSRVENRPNSSVTDFRRQLSRLQSTVPARAGSGARPLGRPLAPSPLQRTAATGRPGDLRNRSVAPHQGPAHRVTRGVHHGRAHGGHPHTSASIRPRQHDNGAARHHRAHRQASVTRGSSAHELRRRRSNVLFMLLITAASTLFLAATTRATFMLYAFALAFLALCGYVYLLAQLRQREQQSWPATWPNDHARR